MEPGRQDPLKESRRRAAEIDEVSVDESLASRQFLELSDAQRRWIENSRSFDGSSWGSELSQGDSETAKRECVSRAESRAKLLDPVNVKGLAKVDPQFNPETGKVTRVLRMEEPPGPRLNGNEWTPRKPRSPTTSSPAKAPNRAVGLSNTSVTKSLIELSSTPKDSIPSCGRRSATELSSTKPTNKPTETSPKHKNSRSSSLNRMDLTRKPPAIKPVSDTTDKKCKPVRGYDVNKTRGFIKQKQKEREEKLAEQKKIKAMEVELKKRNMMKVREAQRQIMLKIPKRTVPNKEDRKSSKPNWKGPFESPRASRNFGSTDSIHIPTPKSSLKAETTGALPFKKKLPPEPFKDDQLEPLNPPTSVLEFRKVPIPATVTLTRGSTVQRNTVDKAEVDKSEESLPQKVDDMLEDLQSLKKWQLISNGSCDSVIRPNTPRSSTKREISDDSSKLKKLKYTAEPPNSKEDTQSLRDGISSSISWLASPPEAKQKSAHNEVVPVAPTPVFEPRDDFGFCEALNQKMLQAKLQCRQSEFSSRIDEIFKSKSFTLSMSEKFGPPKSPPFQPSLNIPDVKLSRPEPPYVGLRTKTAENSKLIQMSNDFAKPIKLPEEMLALNKRNWAAEEVGTDYTCVSTVSTSSRRCPTAGSAPDSGPSSDSLSQVVKVSRTLSRGSTVISEEVSEICNTLSCSNPSLQLSTTNLQNRIRNEIENLDKVNDSLTSYMHSNKSGSAKNGIDEICQPLVDETGDSVALCFNPKNGPTSSSELNFTKFTLQMFDGLIKDEAVRAEHHSASLKTRMRSVKSRVKRELELLEAQRRKMIEVGQDEDARELKRKQRGLLMKMNVEIEEIKKMRAREAIASKERTLILRQQQQLIRLQLQARKKESNKSSRSTLYSPENETVKYINFDRGSTTLDYLDQKTRELREREDSLRERRKNVEAIVAWKKRLEQEEMSVREIEKIIAHIPFDAPLPRVVVDRGTSPFTELKEIALEDPKIEHALTSLSESEPQAKDDYSDSFEQSSVVSENLASGPRKARSASTSSLLYKGRKMPVLKIPLSPRVSVVRRRNSSGSDESIPLSQNETMSDPSDIEVRVSALEQTLKQRKAQLAKLRKEYEKNQKERLRATEKSLINQIQAYDSYIEQFQSELQKDLENNEVKVTRPQIKQPKFSDRRQSDKFTSAPKSKDEIKDDRDEEGSLDEGGSQSGHTLVESSSPSVQSPTQGDGRLPDADLHEVTETKSKSDTELVTLSCVVAAVDESKIESVPESLDKPDSRQSLSEVEGSASNQTSEDVSTDKSVEEIDSEQMKMEELFTDNVSQLLPFPKFKEESEIVETVSSYEPTLQTENQENRSISNLILKDISEQHSEPHSEVSDSEEPVDSTFIEKTEEVEEENAQSDGPSRDRDMEEVEESLVQAQPESDEELDSLEEINSINVSVYSAGEPVHDNEDPPPAQPVTPMCQTAMLQILQESFELSDKLWEENLAQYKKTTEGTPLLSALQRESQQNINVDAISRQICENVIDEATTAALNAYKKKKIIAEEYAALKKDTTQKVGENDGFWLGEGLPLQTAREAEQLRLQQLQIEQEIEQLEQAQEVVPYYYVREIPNKPPPPYTPPRQSTPTPEETVARVLEGGSLLWDIESKGGDPSKAQMPSSFLSSIPDPPYRQFIFDLCQELYLKIKPSKESEPLPPWEIRKRPSRPLPPIKCKEDLLIHLKKETKLVFGFEPKIIRENMISRWTKKRRDHVDDILMRELQEEEAEWTDLSVEENFVKNQIAEGIFSAMIEDATAALVRAFTMKFPEMTSAS